MGLNEIVDNRLNTRGYSYYKLSEEYVISLNSLHSVKNGVRDNFTLEGAIKVFNALELDLNELRKIDLEK